ncbi:cation:proton antiporter [Streptomyces calidiresistens]|uniref:Cation:proton antiporter n=1 Tax=Streptomyces calidiresistens TaxID=1485586 RepID=A0A7W3SZ64_9ACTN|nr:cation:proton antiporter [Streptomyces calidiresistens]MBB0227970.1 cation:proton antiporter [Streptomyces calidiresistens]
MAHSDLAIHFFLQLAVILTACRVVGLLARRVGQPQVVGEMIAGVLLGPSLFGVLMPDWQERLFPDGVEMSILFVASQVGLVLYMFLIGLEFDTRLIRHRISSALSVSFAGICAPMVLGCLAALVLIRQGDTFFPDGIASWQAMFFMGSAVCITAFPMLARIIYERRMTGTPVGTIALAAAATDDAVSWCLLAVVLASIKQDISIAVLAIAGGIVYGLVVLTFGRRQLARLGSRAEREGNVGPAMLAVVLTLLMLAAWITDLIGIYAIFGAFVLGVAMPRGLFAQRVRTALEPLTTNLLLPLFFVFSGLNTQIGLVNTTALWGVTALVLLISILGKGGACWLAARLNGEPQREALALGSLMNARGLMELILLNIGLQAGLITPTLFTIMVIMAIVTTLMASPLFQLFYGRHQRNPGESSVPVAPAGPSPEKSAAAVRG